MADSPRRLDISARPVNIRLMVDPESPEADSHESGAQSVHADGWEAELLRRARAALQRRGLPETPEELKIATRAIGLLMQAEAVQRMEQAERPRPGDSPASVGSEPRAPSPEDRNMGNAPGSPANHEELIYSQHNCPFCHRRRIIARSREGGFVTQNCKKNCGGRGGTPRAVNMEDIPERECTECHGTMRKVYVGKNYAYECPACGITLELHTIVPPWERYFDEEGYAIPGVDFEKY